MSAAATPARGIDPADLETCLAVLREVSALPPDHPDAHVVRRATAQLYKSYKVERRTAKRAAVAEADRAVVAATATGAPGRIDDETHGIPLVSTARGAVAGVLRRSRPCYVCKTHYTAVDAFYHQLCPQCARLHHEKRHARTDLSGRRALLTGGRAKIGMYIALRLLRDGAHTTITTRFPRDAVRRFTALPDAASWLHRLRVVGIDLRDPRQVLALADEVAAQGSLDVLVNNAAQTVRRTPGAYAALAEAESQPLTAAPGAGRGPDVLVLGRTADAHPRGLTGGLDGGEDEAGGPVRSPLVDPSALLPVTRLAMSARSAPVAGAVSVPARGIDAGGLVPDVGSVNSWTQRVQDVDPVELLEVQLCNETAPFLLVSRLRASLAASAARRTYVVNVSAMEGQFARRYKGPGHPHTNMAKAALNMLTRTSAGDLFADGILMTAVDTGWITDERPHTTKVRLAQEGFHAPLDLVDGAARVYDPIVRGERGEDLYGCFLKDFRPSPW